MNYESYRRMWYRMKADLMKKSENPDCKQGEREYLERTLLYMTKEETREREKEELPFDYTVRQDITGNEDIKAPDIPMRAREIFEQITGHKVIDSLEELEREIWKRLGKSLLSDVREPIVVDEKVNIPEHIRNEADLHGIRIARFGVDVISTDALPKGGFMTKKIFPDGFPG